jgi:hypothetical protein
MLGLRAAFGVISVLAARLFKIALHSICSQHIQDAREICLRHIEFLLVPMRKAPLRSEGMSPERTQRLLAEVKAWCKTNNVLQKDLAKMIGVSPQRFNDIMTRRRGCEPTGEQVLQLQELLKSRPDKK